MNRMYPYFGCNFMSIVEHFHCWLHQIRVPQVGSKLHDYIEEINMLYPPEIVQCPGKSPTTALAVCRKMMLSKAEREIMEDHI